MHPTKLAVVMPKLKPGFAMSVFVSEIRKAPPEHVRLMGEHIRYEPR